MTTTPFRNAYCVAFALTFCLVWAASAAPGGPARPASSAGLIVLVTQPGSTIHATPDLHGQALATCAAGERLVVVGDSGAFYRVVMIDGIRGYIPKRDVRLQPGRADIRGKSPLAQRLAAAALRLRGKPGADGAGILRSVYRTVGLTLPVGLGAQEAAGYALPRDRPSLWHPGDRLYLAMHGRRPDTAALWIGNGRLLVPDGPGRTLTVRRYSPFYARRLVGAVRSSELVVGGV